jgi:hypothetical protein F3_00847|nr:MAG TPA: hypothetical protein [Caudoviricetes sp.]
MNLIKIKLENRSGKVTSLELLDQINILRKGTNSNKSQLIHGEMLRIIRAEFPNCIKTGEVTVIYNTREIPNGGHRNDPVYELNMTQAKQILLREPTPIRKVVMNYLETEDVFNSMFKPINVSGIVGSVLNRMDELDDKLNKLDKILYENNLNVNSGVSLTDPQGRVELNNLVLNYSKLTGISLTNAWVEVYRYLDQLYGFDVNNVESLKVKEAKIDKIERCGYIRHSIQIIKQLIDQIKP